MEFPSRCARENEIGLALGDGINNDVVYTVEVGRDFRRWFRHSTVNCSEQHETTTTTTTTTTMPSLGFSLAL